MTTPLKMFGAKDVNLANGGIYQPDASFQVRNRGHDSPNAIFEIHYRSDTTIVHFNQKLKNYIELTPGVMVAVGVKIYDRHAADQRFAAVFVCYERNGNQANLTHLISFGSANLNTAALIAWNASSGGQIVGAIAGAGGIPCVSSAFVFPTYPCCPSRLH